MNPENTHIILGPPGTGKTTKLISTVEEFLQEGTPPERICFVSFTKRAANEAKERAIEKFKLSETQLPYFRTIHSLAFQQMNYEPRQVMNWNNYLDICKMLGLTISSQKISDENNNFIVIQTK